MLAPLLLITMAITENPTSLDQRVENLLGQMTLEEKVSLCHGVNNMATKAIPRLGIPEFRFSDGPNGVRDEEQIPTTYFPTGISMAATWDPKLVQEIGTAIGEEANGLGKSVMLAPAINIDRTPLGGRTFEYYSEDPFLAKQTAIGYIEGIQSQPVLACAKHFAANSVENERLSVDAQVDERTLREIYLPAFEGAVKEAHVGTVMSAYNKLNGHFCSENPHLLKDILKGEWHFSGFVMSDWGAVHSTVPTALGGLDLEMPGDDHNFLADPLLKAVQSGEVPEANVTEMCRRILRTLLPLPKRDVSAEFAKARASGQRSPDETQIVTRAHAELARRVAEQAMVLLKNDSGLLPLDEPKARTVAVIGPNADERFGGSGGSGSVIAPYEITPLEGIQRAFAGATIHYERGVAPRPDYHDAIPPSCFRTPEGQPGLTAEYWDNTKFQGGPKLVRTDANIDFNWNAASPASGFPRTNFCVRWTATLVPPESGKYRIGLASDDGSTLFMDGRTIVNNWGDHGLESKWTTVELQKGVPYAIRVRYYQGGGDAEVHLFWEPVPEQSAQRARAAELARQSDVAIVVAGINHEYDTEGRDKPDMKLQEDEDALIEAVAAANPNTIVVLLNGTPVEMPWISDVHAVLEAWYPGMEGGNAIANVLMGKANPSGKLPITFPKVLADSPAHANGNYPPRNGVLRYDEGILVGYRYFDTKNIEPLFPFGYGLSYTTFQLSDLSVHGMAVSVSVRNVGTREGAEVVQLYIHQPNARVMRPENELKGFAKVHLKPGESKRVTMHLDARSFAYWSDEQHEWVVDGGNYEVRVGTSSRNLPLQASIQVSAATLKP